MKETLQLPKNVIKSDWKDDIDWEPFAGEENYISPAEVKDTTAEQAKALKEKLAISSLIRFRREMRKEAA